MTFKAELAHFHNQLWSYYIPVPKTIAENFISAENRRIICTVNSKLQFQGALMPKGDVYSIYLTKERVKELGVQEGDVLDIQLEKDTSEFGMPLPESFEALLDQDIEGRSLFEGLTKGKQRTLVQIVGKVKNIDSQLAKGLAIMHHLKESEGRLDFKRLNVLIKEYNSKKGSL
jgi:hypothetical protein